MHMVSAADALQEILISESELRTRVTELGEEIRRGYEGLDGRLLVVGMLKGSFIFLADLVRATARSTSWRRPPTATRPSPPGRSA